MGTTPRVARWGWAIVAAFASPLAGYAQDAPAAAAPFGWLGWVLVALLALAVLGLAALVWLWVQARRELTHTRQAVASAQEQQHALELRWQALVQQTPDFVLLTDLEFRISFLNRVSTSAHERPLHEYLGTSVLDYVQVEHLERFRAAFEHARDRGESTVVEVAAGQRSPLQAIFESRIAPIRRGDKIVAILCLGRDITANRRVEKQLQQAQKMEAIGRLAGGVAHDFNNLLTVITCNTLLAKDDIPEDSPALDELKEVLMAAESAASLTQKLLAFSRRQMIKKTYLDLRGTVSEVTRMLNRVIGEHIEVKLQQHPEPLPVVADPGQMEQVIMNLVLNARDAMPRGGTITISTGRTRFFSELEHRHGVIRPGEYVSLTLRDTGTGMPEHVLVRIFEPYFTTKEVGKGSGLGLSMVYGILEQHEGGVLCDSKEGVGTTFTIYLPLAHADQAPQPSMSETRIEIKSPLPQARTILVVEDEPSVRFTTRKMLEKEGYQVLVAADGAEAIKLAETPGTTIHLLFTDVVMPGTNGAELARILREKHPELKVLFTSGYTDSVVIRHGIEASTIEFINKPYLPDDLLRNIRRIVFETG